MKKFLFIIIFLTFNQHLAAELPYYLDFKLILNQSEAGKKAQNILDVVWTILNFLKLFSIE